MWNIIKTVYQDIKKTGKTAGVDLVKGLLFLVNIFPEINKDVSTVSELVEIIDPKAVGLITTITELVGVTEASIKIISEISNILNKINITNIENDAIIIKKDISNLISDVNKFKQIWYTQRDGINKILKNVGKNTIEKVNLNPTSKI